MPWYQPDQALIESIREENEKTLASYRLKPSLITEQFNLEGMLHSAYQGREVFELIQNAADAQRTSKDERRIHLWLKDETLYCANGGEPISLKGLEAIRGAFLSQKTFEDIGHFGVGFKAVLNLSSEPVFLSKAVSFSFDVDCPALREIDPHAPGYPKLRMLIPRDNLEEADFPQKLKWATTVVRLRLHEEKKDILRQSIIKSFEEFPSAFLLFSPHIQKLEFTIVRDHNTPHTQVICQEAQAENGRGTRCTLSRGDGAGTTWRLFKHDMRPEQLPPGAEAPFRVEAASQGVV